MKSKNRHGVQTRAVSWKHNGKSGWCESHIKVLFFVWKYNIIYFNNNTIKILYKLNKKKYNLPNMANQDCKVLPWLVNFENCLSKRCTVQVPQSAVNISVVCTNCRNKNTLTGNVYLKKTLLLTIWERITIVKWSDMQCPKRQSRVLVNSNWWQ